MSKDEIELLDAAMAVVRFANHVGDLLLAERAETTRLRARVAELEAAEQARAMPADEAG